MAKFMETIKKMEDAGLLGKGNKFTSTVNKLKEAGVISYGDSDVKVSAGDTRYNNPKESPKASDELVDKTIKETEIYRRANELILNAQRKQVAYGLDKYPTPLSADVWNILETIDHILDESIDKLHYLVMLRIHLERMAEEEMNNAVEETKDMLQYAMSDLWKTEGSIKGGKFYADGVEFTPDKKYEENCNCDGDESSEFDKDVYKAVGCEHPPITGETIKEGTLNRLHDDDIDAIAYAVLEAIRNNKF